MALFGSKKNTAKKAPAKKAAKKAPAKKAKDVAFDKEGKLERYVASPRITEKATYAIAKGCYVFVVPDDATKKEIAKAIEATFKVTPRQVNIVRIAPRKVVSRARNTRGTKSGHKKAYVFLAKGDKLDII